MKLGVIGGTGQLGRAIVSALVGSGTVEPRSLWISNRSGAADLPVAWAGANQTVDNRELVERCDVVLLSVPPAAFPAIGINAADKLVVSVMAGVTIERIADQTGARRIVRAMSSPAAEYRAAYSPWLAAPGVTDRDREIVSALFGACGTTDEIEHEDHLNLFTAITGPVPGFVALFAATMIDYTVERGVAPEVADRAIRQLFAASGRMLAHETESARAQVDAMVRYAGTTAAGLEAMLCSPLADQIKVGLDAARDRARTIADG